jgi:hypothetical protein
MRSSPASGGSKRVSRGNSAVLAGTASRAAYATGVKPRRSDTWRSSGPHVASRMPEMSSFPKGSAGIARLASIRLHFAIRISTSVRRALTSRARLPNGHQTLVRSLTRGRLPYQRDDLASPGAKPPTASGCIWLRVECPFQRTPGGKQASWVAMLLTSRGCRL